MSNPLSSRMVVAVCASALLSAAVTAGVMGAGSRGTPPNAGSPTNARPSPAAFGTDARTFRDPSLPEASSIVQPLTSVEEVATF